MGMKNRRSFFGLAMALLLGLAGKARTRVRGDVRELARHALTGPEQGMEAILVEVIAPPGAPSTVRERSRAAEFNWPV